MWRVQRIGAVEAAIKFRRLCQSSSSAAKRSRRAAVSRETGTSARARARSAARSGGATCWFTCWGACQLVCRLACGLAARGAAHMSNQERQRRWRNAIDAAGLPDRPWAMKLQLLPHLVGQARQRRIIEIIAENETFIAAIGLNVGCLSAEI